MRLQTDATPTLLTTYTFDSQGEITITSNGETISTIDFGPGKNIVANQRHLKVVNLILLQNYFALDNKVREIVNNVIFFKMDKKQTQKIFEEMIEMPKYIFEEINKIVFDEPHKWVLINQRQKRIYSMFDEIVIDDDDEDEN